MNNWEFNKSPRK